MTVTGYFNQVNMESTLPTLHKFVDSPYGKIEHWTFCAPKTTTGKLVFHLTSLRITSDLKNLLMKQRQLSGLVTRTNC